MRLPLDIVFDGEAQRLFDSFTVCFGIRIVLFSAEGRMLRTGLDRPCAAYCRLVQERLYGVDRCRGMDAAQQRLASDERRMLCYRCHAGFNEVIKPIYRDDEALLGFIMIGQFRTGNTPPDHVVRDWRAKHGDVSDLRDAYRRAPLYPPERLDGILDLFSAMVDYIVSRRMIYPCGGVLLQRVMAYIDAHAGEPVSLEDVARAVGRSPSSISHVFRDRLGTTYKATLIEARLRRAEAVLRKGPGATVKEACYCAGYDDPAYFSRLYRRVRGESPSAYRRRWRMQASE